MTILVWQVKQKPDNLADSGEPARLEPISAQRLRRVKLIIQRYCFSNLPWVISECPAPFVGAYIAQGWL